MDLKTVAFDGERFSKKSTTTPTDIGGSLPIGAITAYAIETAPDGWLLCNGNIYNINDYPYLGSLLTNTYGGNGTTTFAVPDLRGRVPAGRDKMGAASTANRVVTTTYIQDNIRTYSGTYNGYQVRLPTISGIRKGDYVVVKNPSTGIVLYSGTVKGVTSNSGIPYAYFSTPLGTNAGDYNSFPAIFTPFSTSASTLTEGDVLGSVSGSQTHTLLDDEISAHSHSFSMYGAASGHTHSGSSTLGPAGYPSSTTGTTSKTTSTIGSDAPHNNLQPTLLLNYIIRAV
jgi:microcystin-dependent protein